MDFEVNVSEETQNTNTIDVRPGSSWSICSGGRIRIQGKRTAESDTETIFDRTVPEGRKWKFRIVLNIEESPA